MSQHLESTEFSQMLYVGCALSGELYTARISLTNGALDYVDHLRLPELVTPGGAMPLALSRRRDKLYAVSRGEPFFIAAFAIDSHGRLVHERNIPIDTNLAYIEQSPSGDYLLSASFIDHHVSAFGVEAEENTVTQAQLIEHIPNAHMLTTAPKGNTVLATGLGDDTLHQWHWLPKSAGDPALPLEHSTKLKLPHGTGPRHIAFHPQLPLAYVIGERNGTVSVVRYAPEGFELVQTANLAAQTEAFQAADIHITPDGRFLYASEKATSTLQLYTVEPDGSLVFQRRFATENRPRGFAITSNGHFLIAAGQFSDHISSYRIDLETGHLNVMDRLAVGKSPDWIEIC